VSDDEQILELRREIRSTISQPAVHHGRLLGFIAESILLLVESVDRLTDSYDQHASKTAAAVDYISESQRSRDKA
jgi:hypothetical protein